MGNWIDELDGDSKRYDKERKEEADRYDKELDDYGKGYDDESREKARRYDED